MIGALTDSTMKTRTPRIPIYGKQEPEISGGRAVESAMLALLEEVGGQLMAARIGREQSVEMRSDIAVRRGTGRTAGAKLHLEITKGTEYRSATGSSFGGRYLMRVDGAGIVGMLGYTVIERHGGARQVVVSSLCVAPEWRRKGIASALLTMMTKDYPEATVDSAMTPDGAAFFGYASAKEMAPGRGDPDGLANGLAAQADSARLRRGP